MSKPFAIPVFSLTISFVTVLPFILMELINAQAPGTFPFMLFGFLWLVSFLFMLLLSATIRSHRHVEDPLRNVVIHVAKFLTLVLLAGLWITIIKDQLPCFLGFPNCD